MARTAPLLDASGTLLARSVIEATTPWMRTFGLLGRRSMSDDDGMLFRNCSSIHTYFMRMCIDVVFVDRDWRVLQVLSELPPWRVAHAAGASYTVELAAGAAQRASITAGMQLHPVA